MARESRDKCLIKCAKYLDQFTLSTKDMMMPRMDFVYLLSNRTDDLKASNFFKDNRPSKKGCGSAEFLKRLDAVATAYTKKLKACSADDLSEQIRQKDLAMAETSTRDSASRIDSKDNSEAREVKQEEKNKRVLLAKCKEHGDCLW